MKRVFALMLAAFMLLGAGEAFASEFSLRDYTVFTFGERQLVYQGPGETYFKHGNAAVGASNNARLYGTLDNCLMVGYGYSTDKFRVGWVPIPAPEKDKRTVLQACDSIGELRFDMVLRTTKDECAATYDPVKVSMRNIEIKKGATINVLCWYGEWAYCEFRVDKKLSWAFMYADMLNAEPLAKPAPELKTNGTERKAVLKEIVAKTPGGNYGLFSGPGENYLRADAGGAHIRPMEKCYVIGGEGDWAFVRVAAAGGDKYGYLPTASMPDRAKLKEVSFDCTPAVIAGSAALRDAPNDSAALLLNLPAEAEVNFLAWSDSAHHYAYVEYKAEGLRARGFIPADSISQ